MSSFPDFVFFHFSWSVFLVLLIGIPTVYLDILVVAEPTAKWYIWRPFLAAPVFFQCYILFLRCCFPPILFCIKNKVLVGRGSSDFDTQYTQYEYGDYQSGGRSYNSRSYSNGGGYYRHFGNSDCWASSLCPCWQSSASCPVDTDSCADYSCINTESDFLRPCDTACRRLLIGSLWPSYASFKPILMEMIKNVEGILEETGIGVEEDTVDGGFDSLLLGPTGFMVTIYEDDDDIQSRNALLYAKRVRDFLLLLFSVALLVFGRSALGIFIGGLVYGLVAYLNREPGSSGIFVSSPDLSSSSSSSASTSREGSNGNRYPRPWCCGWTYSDTYAVSVVGGILMYSFYDAECPTKGVEFSLLCSIVSEPNITSWCIFYGVLFRTMLMVHFMHLVMHFLSSWFHDYTSTVPNGIVGDIINVNASIIDTFFNVNNSTTSASSSRRSEGGRVCAFWVRNLLRLCFSFFLLMGIFLVMLGGLLDVIDLVAGGWANQFSQIANYFLLPIQLGVTVFIDLQDLCCLGSSGSNLGPSGRRSFTRRTTSININCDLVSFYHMFSSLSVMVSVFALGNGTGAE